MSEPIGLEELPTPVDLDSFAGSSALDLSRRHDVVLRFRLTGLDDSAGLEALRHARRSILREEWTRGREPAEPCLDEAVFSPTEVLWRVLPEQRDWCLEKLEDLLARANRTLGADRT